MAKLLEIRVGPPGDALDRFEAGWNRVVGKGRIQPLFVLSMENLPQLVKCLSPARWALLEDLRREGPCSIYELAKRLERNYKNVHTDVSELVKLGLIEKSGKTEVGVAWDAVRAELRF